MSDQSQYIKGRGAQINVPNRFFAESQEMLDDFLNYCAIEGDDVDSNKTSYLEVFPKTIVNKVESPDLRMGYSMNPYQRCEHGCIFATRATAMNIGDTARDSISNAKSLSRKMRPSCSKKSLKAKTGKPKPLSCQATPIATNQPSANLKLQDNASSCFINTGILWPLSQKTP